MKAFGFIDLVVAFGKLRRFFLIFLIFRGFFQSLLSLYGYPSEDFLQYLKFYQTMGQNSSCIQNKHPTDFVVACLNYSGVQQSPYQFYQYDTKAQKFINQLFQEMCTRYVQGFSDAKFKWIMGKIDKDWHQRLSPLYHIECGVKSDGKMMNSTQFKQEWNRRAKEQFNKVEDKVYGKLPKEQREKVRGQELEQCLDFDLAVYRAILKMVYKIDEFEVIDLDSGPYLEYQSKMFSKSFLNRQIKEQITIEAIKSTKTDIIFAQEADSQIIEAVTKNLQQFQVVEKMDVHCTSVILFKKEICPEIKDFKEANQKFISQYEKRVGVSPETHLFWNDDTVFQVLTHHILISAHLSSKKQHNQIQIQKMKDSLGKLKKYFSEYEIIVGGDINGNLEYGFEVPATEQKALHFNVYPNIETDLTVNKKRTLMQAQKHKANKFVNQVKDYLITTKQLTQCQIMTISGEIVEKGKKIPLLPNSQHPYDHYLVMGKVKK